MNDKQSVWVCQEHYENGLLSEHKVFCTGQKYKCCVSGLHTLFHTTFSWSTIVEKLKNCKQLRKFAMITNDSLFNWEDIRNGYPKLSSMVGNIFINIVCHWLQVVILKIKITSKGYRKSSDLCTRGLRSRKLDILMSF